jgi:DNA polymerase-3 subunit delta'
MSGPEPRVEPDRREGAPHPRETDVLFGQAAAEARFLSALDAGRMHHAWMITGPRGVGKATLAWRIARHMIAGGAGGSLDLPPEHPVFRQTAALSSPALWLCRRGWDDKAARLRTAISVDDVRALKGFFQLSAAGGGWRVAIVDAADEMTPSAANALLKILEEPPPRAMILLVCHQPTLLLPTIRSRCRDLRCAPLGTDDLSAALVAAGADAATVGPLASLAGGSPGRALDLLAGDGLGLYAEILAMLSSAPPIDRSRASALAEACSGRRAEARYASTLDLIEFALSRLALAGASQRLDPVDDTEGALARRLSASARQAAVWAALIPDLHDRAARARAVNLDPVQVILDICLRIDAAATDALARAA